jgi:hypothetical protein
MRPLSELLNTIDPAYPLVQTIITKAIRPVELLPPSASRADVLLQTQVTTRSTMGAVAYETGGILIDHGWLRLLGSGHPRLTRTLPAWNQNRSSGFYLIADDAVGGFFAINGGALGSDIKNVYYFAPDSLRWKPLNLGSTDFLNWACSGKLDLFCQNVRWPSWQADVTNLHGDQCLMTFPPLWTVEGKQPSAKRSPISVNETWGLQMEFRNQLDLPQQ